MGDTFRVQYAIEYVTGSSVFVVRADSWYRMVRPDGEPTLLTRLPDPFDGVQHDAGLVAATASGTLNREPGIDLIRVDPGDAPYIYNLDHYGTIEHLSRHPRYEDVVRIAQVEKSEALDRFMDEHVFFVGPEKTEDHWCVTLPEHIKAARLR